MRKLRSRKAREDTVTIVATSQRYGKPLVTLVFSHDIHGIRRIHLAYAGGECRHGATHTGTPYGIGGVLQKRAEAPRGGREVRWKLRCMEYG